MNLPAEHPREEITQKAERDLEDAMYRAVLGLTSAEKIDVVMRVTYRLISGIAKYSIRFERHRDTNKPGGLV